MEELPKLCKPQLIGLDPERPGLVNVFVRLDPPPDADWLKTFRQQPTASTHSVYSVANLPPEVVGDRVQLRCPPKLVGACLRELEEQVEYANKGGWKARDDLDMLPPEEKLKQRSARHRRRWLEEAQQQIDALSD